MQDKQEIQVPSLGEEDSLEEEIYGVEQSRTQLKRLSRSSTVREVEKFLTQLRDFHTSFIWIQMLVYRNACFLKK